MEHAAISTCLIISLPGAMEAILEEECHRERKLREYEVGRAEVTRTLLSQLVLFNGFLVVVFIIIIVVACLSYVICPIPVCAVCYVVTKFVIMCLLYFVYACDSLLGAVTQLWKATVTFINFVRPSVCLST
jgi:hypothetical protein